jgi:hypothetical protein
VLTIGANQVVKGGGQIAGYVKNHGTIIANLSIPLIVQPGLTNDGVMIADGGTLELKGDISGNGSFIIDAGFTRDNAIDLGDFGFAGNPTITSVSFVGSDTLVTVNDGAQSVTIDLFGASHSNNSILASDHRGANPGTLLEIA